jgi:hypothetical protein
MARAAVQNEAERYSSLLEASAAGLATDEHLTWEDFDAATAPLASAGLIGASSVAFVVPATDAQVPAVQELWRSRGADGLTLRPWPGASDHYFSIFTRPLHSSDATGGGDFAAAPESSQALADARRMSRPTVSDLPAAQQHSFVFAAPIWPRSADPQFRGWLLLGVHGQDFLDGVLATVSQGQLDGELRAHNDDGTQPAVARYFVPGDPDLERQGLLDVADREWTLVVRADSANLPGARSALPAAVLAGGIAITLILAALVYLLATKPVAAQTEEVPGMRLKPKKDETDDEAREKLERALAERAAMEDVRLPGITALPAAEPSAHDPAAARLRSPVPHHQPAK